jgi:hypothetical protein
VTIAKIHPTLLFPQPRSGGARRRSSCRLLLQPRQGSGLIDDGALVEARADNLLPLLRKGFGASMRVASTKPAMQAVTSIGGMSVSGPSRGVNAGPMMLGSTIRDRLWVSLACGPSAIILSLSHARPRARPL